MSKVLVIDGRSRIFDLVSESLSGRHTVTAPAAQGDESADLVIVDLDQPIGDGLDVCRKLARRAVYEPLRFIVVTRIASLAAKRAAFELGAEDYVVVPTDWEELGIRIEARLRRPPVPGGGSELRPVPGLRIDLSKFRVWTAIGGSERDCDLTPREFRLVKLLIDNENQIWSRSELLKVAWGEDLHVLARTVDRHISTLRRKLGPLSRHILAVPGKGYKWSPAGEGAPPQQQVFTRPASKRRASRLERSRRS